MNNIFDTALWAVSPKLKKILFELSEKVKSDTYEIRLRADRPVMLYGKYGSMFFCRDASLTKHSDDNIYICSNAELNDTFNRLCGYSIHTYQQDINNGFVTVKGGHRVGICGTAVCNGYGDIVSIKDVTSLNIRIARNIKGCSDVVVKSLLSESDKSVIIAGAPSSGKTTLLKDLAENLSSGRQLDLKKVSVIDERCELSANAYEYNADLLCSYPKDKAIMCALRTLSPEYIICDEIGSNKDIDSIIQGVNSGVNFIVSVHSFDIEDFLRRPQTQALLETRCFKNVVLLNSANEPCRIKEIYDAEELLYEVYRRRAGVFDNDLYRLSDIAVLQKEMHAS